MGRAGKFSLLTVGVMTVGLEVEVVGLGAVVVVGVLGLGFDLAVLRASSLVLYTEPPL